MGGSNSLLLLFERKQERPHLNPNESHVRPVKEVTGYHIRAEHGTIGHVEKWIVEERFWTIHYLVVDTRNWLPGRKVFVALGYVKSVQWKGPKVRWISRFGALRNSLEHDRSIPVNREIEIRVYDYHGRHTHREEPFLDADSMPYRGG